VFARVPREPNLSAKSIGICLACYNRRDVTLKCLQSVKHVVLPRNYELLVYLVDDASPDGTGDAVRDAFPEAVVISGNGALYWGGGMRVAMSKAMAQGHDFYLWLNDDLELFPDAIYGALKTYDLVTDCGKQPALVVAATCDEAGRMSYGGMRRKGLSPIGFKKINPDPIKPILCDTMNGNFVLIPAQIANTIGNIDARFPHRIGDVDYGLRARDAGFEVWLAPGYAGRCPRNQRLEIWQSANHSLFERWRDLRSPLGAPLGEWLLYGFRHGGLVGIFTVLLQYRWFLFPRRSK